MAITNETPQASKGFKEWQRTLYRHSAQRVSQIVAAGNQLRAMTATHRRKR